MVEIERSVGQGGKNQKSDGALVQVMLVTTTDASGKPYLESYDGDVGPKTIEAIRAFQRDHVQGPSSMDAGAGRALLASPGRVEPGDVTLRKLNELLVHPYTGIRAIPGTRTVYIGATAVEFAASKANVAGQTLDAEFKRRLLVFLDEMFTKHGVVIQVTPAWADGGRRTFQQQRNLWYRVDDDGNRVTNAGPGESNHNFGRAVDVGFNELRWLKADGTIVEDEDWWLHKLDKAHKGKPHATELFTAMRAVATGGGAGLFRGPAKDWPHLQAYSDAGIDMATRLAALLTSAGRMKWSGANQRYKCDLGLGGDFYAVGTALEIWEKRSPVKADDLQKAKAAADARAHPQPAAALQPILRGPQARGAHAAHGPQAAHGRTAAPVLPAVTATELEDLKKALYDDFKSADDAWMRWSAV